MIIKQADDKQPQIDTLRALLSHPSADAGIQKRIDKEIRNIQAGARGEAEAAYEMQVHYGKSKNWMIINDLRIEHDGLVAQIDHLLINRFLDFWVCESKHFSEGVAINEHGEFSAFYGKHPYGVPSPIEQNNKHVLILQRFFDSGAVSLPSRLGFTIKPALKSLVLVSKGARITRPKNKIEGIDCIVKNDQMVKLIDKAMDETTPLAITKVIGTDTLEQLARDIVSHHKPIEVNWSAKFGLADIPSEVVNTPASSSNAAVVTNENEDDPASALTGGKDTEKPKKKLICHDCGVGVTYTVAKFCWFNKKRFNGEIYCMECQKKY